MASSAAERTSAEAESSRPPHREVTNGFLRTSSFSEEISRRNGDGGGKEAPSHPKPVFSRVCSRCERAVASFHTSTHPRFHASTLTCGIEVVPDDSPVPPLDMNTCTLFGSVNLHRAQRRCRWVHMHTELIGRTIVRYLDTIGGVVSMRRRMPRTSVARQGSQPASQAGRQELTSERESERAP